MVKMLYGALVPISVTAVLEYEVNILRYPSRAFALFTTASIPPALLMPKITTIIRAIVIIID